MQDVTPLVKCCLNGGRDPAEHSSLPGRAETAAREAASAVAAGAGALHVHPRGGDGRESLDAATISSWVAAIRGSCPGISLGVSTGAWIEPDPDVRVRAISAWRAPLPDFASVNLFEEGAGDVARACLARGIGIEAGLWTAEDVGRLVDTNLEGRWLRVLVEAICAAADQPARVLEIDAALEEAHIVGPRLYHGYGEGTWTVIRNALERGRDVRVGLEDVLVLPDGRPAAGNADLIAAARALAPSAPAVERKA